MRQAVWIKNRTPHKALKDIQKTPYELINGVAPDYSKDMAYGARVYATIPPEKQGEKLHAPRAELGYFLCSESETIMWIWNPDKKRASRITTARVDNRAGFDDDMPMSHVHRQPPDPSVTSPTPESDDDEEFAFMAQKRKNQAEKEEERRVKEHFKGVEMKEGSIRDRFATARTAGILPGLPPVVEEYNPTGGR
ncbi:hypothetical protein DM02DRAFT_648463 [Periconia macrospinosa]|uniref:Uncharacterized protein n=1 Tax=Periconia macrospinosa TaxID=97972 RepID=A0A2V1EBF8_9PLEO|nr:hypothetical protein DM02DRAFT_648463 [Periconia macrospinosa]